jgi:hypothetical protein
MVVIAVQIPAWDVETYPRDIGLNKNRANECERIGSILMLDLMHRRVPRSAVAALSRARRGTKPANCYARFRVGKFLI